MTILCEPYLEKADCHAEYIDHVEEHDTLGQRLFSAVSKFYILGKWLFTINRKN